MSPRQFVTRVRLPAPAAEVLAWHDRPGAQERLLPPWDLGGAEGSWQHTRRVIPDGAGALLEDVITHEGPPGSGLERRIGTRFGHRQRRLARDLARHAFAAAAGPRTVAITGASGFVGRALTAFLTSGGHRVLRLVRTQPRSSEEIAWDPAAGRIDAAALEGVDAVVNLAGENIAGGRWTTARKRLLRDSRLLGTDLLARTLAGLKTPPEVLVSASGINVYTPAPPSQPRSEEAPAGQDFLAQLVTDWETAAEPARAGGIRVVHPRFASMLHPGGGALARLLPLFRAGVAGRLGSGEQAMSWITLDDALGAVHRALFDRRLTGAVNVATPTATTNGEFTATLAGVLGRPAVLPVPGLALRAVYGEMAEVLLLAGVAVLPRRLQAVGFEFETTDSAAALAELLGKGPAAVPAPTPPLVG